MRKAILLVSFFLLCNHISVGRGQAGPKFPPTYCGVQALALAQRSYGRKISFKVLLKPEYISSKRGSSAADLVRAANDLGLGAYVKRNLTCAILRNLDCPVILHVKSSYESLAYEHWILYAGMKGSQAVIYDGTLPPSTIELEDLAGRWDGVAVVLEDESSNTIWILIAYLANLLFVAGIAASALAIVLWSFDRFLKPRLGRSRMAIAPLEAASIFGLAIVLLVAFRSVNAGGFLSCSAAIEGIQENSLGTFLPKVTCKQVEELAENSGAVIVDARSSEDYNRDHVVKSINIPYYYSPEKAAKVLDGIGKDTLCIVYCEGYGCSFCDYTARNIWKLGYENLALFKEGWQAWQEYKRR